MPTTQLFVELLVIGIGVVAWLLLLVAAVTGMDLHRISSHLVGDALVPLSALSYVLGIVVDRFARWIFDKVPDEARTAASGMSFEYKHSLICYQSERLWSRCVYTRSRFRICRAWTLNFALFAVAYYVWDRRFPGHSSGVIIVVALFFAALTGWAARRFNQDCINQADEILQVLGVDTKVSMLSGEPPRGPSKSAEARKSESSA